MAAVFGLLVLQSFGSDWKLKGSENQTHVSLGIYRTSAFITWINQTHSNVH